MRQEILEGFGWTFHRIWSTDWFHRRTSEIERLKQAIEIAQSKDLTLSIEGSNHSSPAELEPYSAPINREDLDLKSSEINVPCYEKAELKVNYRYEPHECPISRIADLVVSIVSVEGPIHIDEIARRYAEAYGKTRVGSRIASVVEKGVLSAERDGRIISSDGFWGTTQQFENVPVRDRENESPPLTKPNYISEEEIRACAALIEKESGSMDSEELIRTISRVFGFKRAGPDFQKRVGDVLKQKERNP